MITMIDHIYKYRVHQLSQQIFDLKQANPKLAPGHAEWKKLQDLKSQASLCLTAINILKNTPCCKGFVVGRRIPLKEDLRKALKENRKKFISHCPKDRIGQNSHIFGAYYDLCKTQQELEADPKKFDAAGAYVEQRQKEAAEAKAAKEAAHA